MNPLRKLAELGQSVWLDSLSRALLREGRLRRLIQDDGVTGITSNPAIFDQAITRSNDYDDAIRNACEETGDPERIFERLVIADIRDAADELELVFLATAGRDGYVSLEVSPLLAHDTAASVQHGRALWRAVARKNLYIKIPATAAGLPAIRQLLTEGINVNVTLLFSLPRYREVIAAWQAGVAAGRRNGAANLSSVASFFLSRIDTKVDQRLDTLIAHGGSSAALARELRGRAAVAQAQLAYQIQQETFGADRPGRSPMQRLLWASTSTKDPAYMDVKYVEALIGPDTITTLPLATLEAYRDHGDPQVRLADDLESAAGVLAALGELDIELDDITTGLEAEGIEQFVTPYRRALEHLETKVAQLTA